MVKLGFPHNPEERRLFTDASQLCLKDDVLHDGNIKPLITVAHSVVTRSTAGRYVILK